MKIIVNGQAKEIEPEPVSYERALELAEVTPAQAKAFHSVTFRARIDANTFRQGMLMPGRSIEPLEGMVFNAYVTGAA